MNWDDYRYVGVLAAAGTVRDAARELKVNASTVTRRIDQLEERLGVKLFFRQARGVQVTNEGARVLEHIRRVEDDLTQIETTLLGLDQNLEGGVSMAIDECVGSMHFYRVIAEFQRTYPAITVSVHPVSEGLRLDRGEVDAELRLTNAPPEHLVGRPLGVVELGVYRSAANTEGWVEWHEESEIAHENQLIRARYVPNVQIRFVGSTLGIISHAIRSGLGAGILPRVVGDSDPLLQRVEEIPIEASAELWLLTHPNRRGARKIQVLTQHLMQQLTQTQIHSSHQFSPQSSSRSGEPGLPDHSHPGQ